MQYTIKCLLLFAGVIPALFLNAQEVYNPDARFAPAALRQDLDVLAEALKDVHPDLYRYVSEEDFDAEVNRIKAELTDSLTELQFHLKVRALIAGIKCGHTVAKPSDAWYRYFREEKKALPFDVLIADGKLLVNQVFSDSLPFRKGDEILSVAGVDSGELLSQMMQMQQRDGYHLTFIYNSIESYFRTYFAFLFGSVGQVEVGYLGADSLPGKAVVPCPPPQAAPAKPLVDSPERFSDILEGNGVYLGFPKSGDSLALLRILKFHSRGYVGFYKKAFREMEARDVQTLLIDLRNCGGGYFLNGNRLLRYLKDERFFMHFFRPRGRVDRSRFLKSEFWVTMTRFSFELMPDLQKNGQRDYKLHYKPIRRHHFDGKIVVLIDGGSFSMSANVAAMLALEPNTTLIGEESGGAAEGANAILWRKLVLPHTGVSVSIPEYHLSNQYPNGPFGRGLIPGRELKRSPEDVLNGRDPVLEQVIKELRSEGGE